MKARRKLYSRQGHQNGSTWLWKLQKSSSALDTKSWIPVRLLLLPADETRLPQQQQYLSCQELDPNLSRTTSEH